MSLKSKTLRPYLIRLGVVLLVSAVFVGAFNEASYWLQKEDHDRAPTTVQLVIPLGTAEQIDAGQNVASIPSEMVFVTGDVLEVKNEDVVSHQLGPVWVPPGATASLAMEQADRFSYSCSFQTSRYLGLDVRQPTTLGTRLTALGIGAPTMATLLFIYSLLIFPVRPASQAAKSETVRPNA